MLRRHCVTVLLGMTSLVSASNLLTNPSFNEPAFEVITCQERNLQIVPGWFRLAVQEPDGPLQRTGPLAFRNGYNFVPDCPRDPEGDNDSIHASIEFCDVGVREGIEQTISGVTPGATMTFSGWWSIGNGKSRVIGPDTDAFAFAELHDGPDGDGEPVASTMIVAPAPQEPDWFTKTNWQPFSISGVITGSDVTVRVWILSGMGVCQELGFHLDACVLTEVAPCHTPFADADGDGDVDGTDFAIFQRCITGDEENHPPISAGPAYCPCFNREGDDDDIDAADFQAFLNCVTGPMIPHATHPNPLCEDRP